MRVSGTRSGIVVVIRSGRFDMSARSVGLGEIARVFLKIGAMSYGGPAIMGIMQMEIQEKRQWVEKPQFVEGLALVNMLPGPGATQLGIYLGHARAGLAGGIIALLVHSLFDFNLQLPSTSLLFLLEAAVITRIADERGKARPAAEPANI